MKELMGGRMEELVGYVLDGYSCIKVEFNLRCCLEFALSSYHSFHQFLSQGSRDRQGGPEAAA